MRVRSAVYYISMTNEESCLYSLITDWHYEVEDMTKSIVVFKHERAENYLLLNDTKDDKIYPIIFPYILL